MGMVIVSEWGWIVRSLDCRPSWNEDAVVWSRGGVVGPHGRDGVGMRWWGKEEVQ